MNGKRTALFRGFFSGACLFLAFVIPARAELIWTIGTFDGTYEEFAIAGKNEAYASAFPKDVTYRIGTSSPEKDWPYVHPGPLDGWPGRRLHPFRIEFTLADCVLDDVTLILALIDIHPKEPPLLQVDVNGSTFSVQLPSGRNSESLKDWAKGDPYAQAVRLKGARWLRGRNVITLTVVKGSWMLYDGLSLEGKRIPVEYWSIGSSDDSCEEFAISRDFKAYAQRFPEDVNYTVGTSVPARDWPCVHPGPADPWAGSRPHPFRIEFDRAKIPPGDCTLTVAVRGTNPGNPSKLTVSVNGNACEYPLPAGEGKDALTNPEAGKTFFLTVPFAGRVLHPERNEIVLTVTGGSWLLYDAVNLDMGLPPAGESEILRFDVEPTIFFANDDRTGAVRQVFEATIVNSGPAKAGNIAISMGGKPWTLELPDIGFGTTRQTILVREVSKPEAARLTLTADGRALTTQAEMLPQRKWLIFVSPHMHTDIGYTAPQPEVVEHQRKTLDAAVEACERLPDFTWNCEIAWQAEVYKEGRPPERWEKLLDLMRKGRVGLHAAFMNMLTGLLSHEELNRLFAYAKRLGAEQGVPVASATITDVPSCVGALPMVLSRSGIRAFAQGMNLYRGPFLSLTDVRSPFWWEGPDGSTVLAWFTRHYSQASALGLFVNTDEVKKQVPAFLQGYERAGYPYDAVLVYGAFPDNGNFNSRFAEIASEWNRTFAYPRIVFCRDEQFFDHIASNFADKIPTFKGDAGAYWEDGAASSAFETAMNRGTHEKLPTAEKLHSVNLLLGSEKAYPGDELRRAWEDTMWFDEHTWGAAASSSDPTSPVVAEIWKLKAEPAYRAAASVESLVKAGLDALASQVKTGERKAVFVFNPLSWTRTDVVRIGLPRPSPVAKAPEIADAATGEEIPAQWARRSAADWELVFVARDVPPLGYRLYEIREPGSSKKGAGMKKPKDSPGAGGTLENSFFRIAPEPRRGGLASIYDKRLERELLASGGPFSANQYLYVSFKDKEPVIHTLGSVAIQPGGAGRPAGAAGSRTPAAGPVFRSILIRGRALHTPSLESEIILYEDLPRIDFINRLNKKVTFDKEAVYFAFPFAGEAPEFAFEGPDAIVDPAKDMLKGACLDWFAVQHFVDVSGAQGGVTWAGPDSPLVCLGGLTAEKWLKEFKPEAAAIFAYVMNNAWTTNYKAGQGGDFTFRYSITSHAGGFDPVASTRFGWETGNPLLAVVAPANQEGPLTEPAGSFCSIRNDNVVLLAFKQAEDGNGWIVRLWEVAGKSGPVQLEFPLRKPARAWLADMVEENAGELPVAGNTLSVQVDARSVVTVRVLW